MKKLKNKDKSVEVLLAQINSGLEVMSRLEKHLDEFIANEVYTKGKTPIAAIVVADALCRYYTAVETIFFRIKGKSSAKYAFC